jgi:hypothetical protein
VQLVALAKGNAQFLRILVIAAPESGRVFQNAKEQQILREVLLGSRYEPR